MVKIDNVLHLPEAQELQINWANLWKQLTLSLFIRQKKLLHLQVQILEVK